MPDIGQLLRTKSYLFALLLAFVLLVANIVVEPSFADPSNWTLQLLALSPLALVAMANTPAIVSGGGGLDISVATIAVVVNTILVAWFLPRSGLDSVWVAVPLLMLIGGALGAVNGTLVAVFRFQPVIATLCAFFVLGGIALKIAPSPVRVASDTWVKDLSGDIGPLPGSLFLLVIPVVIWLALSLTSYHRNLYAVGGNATTAFSAGTNVTAIRIAAYALGGVFAAVSGIAITVLVQSTAVDAALTYTLIALAAVALGGTQLTGGRGGLFGAFVGALCIYLIQTLLGAAHVSSSWLQFVYGVMLVAGVVVGARLTSQRPKEATG